MKVKNGHVFVHIYIRYNLVCVFIQTYLCRLTARADYPWTQRQHTHVAWDNPRVRVRVRVRAKVRVRGKVRVRVRVHGPSDSTHTSHGMT